MNSCAEAWMWLDESAAIMHHSGKHKAKRRVAPKPLGA